MFGVIFWTNADFPVASPRMNTSEICINVSNFSLVKYIKNDVL